MRQWLDDQKKFINEQCVADLLSAYAGIKTAGPEKVERGFKKVKNNIEREMKGNDDER